MKPLQCDYDIVDGIPRFVKAKDDAGSVFLRPEGVRRLTIAASAVLTRYDRFPPDKRLAPRLVGSAEYGKAFFDRCNSLSEAFAFATVTGLAAALSVPAGKSIKAFKLPTAKATKELQQQRGIPWITRDPPYRTPIRVNDVYVDLEYAPVALYLWLRIDRLRRLRRKVWAGGKHLRRYSTARAVEIVLETIDSRVILLDLELERVCNALKERLTLRRGELDELMEPRKLPVICLRHGREAKFAGKLSRVWHTMGVVTFTPSRSIVSKLYSSDFAFPVRGFGPCAGLLDVKEGSSETNYGMLFDETIPRCPFYPAPLLSHEPHRLAKVEIMRDIDDDRWYRDLFRTMQIAAMNYDSLHFFRNLSKIEN